MTAPLAALSDDALLEAGRRAWANAHSPYSGWNVGAAAGGRRLVRLALTCHDAAGRPVTTISPCGACLQVIAEFGTADTAIVIDGRGIFRLADFLPLPFGADSLKAHADPAGFKRLEVQ